jgi:hypothetical protein
MATAGGPKKITDGLVVSFDAANDKSFRGEPTVNLLGAAGSDAEIERSGNTYPYYSVNINSLVQSNWSEGNNVITISFEGKRDFSVGGTGGGGDGYPVFYVYFTDWSWATTLGITSYDWSYNERTVTIPNPSGKTVFFSIYHMNAGNPGKSYSRKHQIEFKSYSTPFVNGTRGTTVATGGGWIDRSGSNNHGELVNSPLYTSEGLGGLKFDGTDSSITIPFNSSMDFSQAQTICMWLKPGTGSNSTRRNPYNQAYGGSGTLTHEPSQTINYYFGTHGGNSSPYVGRNSGFTVAPNELAFITVTRSQSLNLCRWYKNGQAGNFDNAGGYSSTNNGSSPILIANGYTNRFLGDIYGVFIYNRYMTQDEVQQMYNATKGRYGL